MLERTRRIVGSFEAAAEPDKLRRLLVVEDIFTATTYVGTGQSKDNPRYVTTEDGRVIMTRIGKGEYQDPETGEIFVTTNPIAP